MRHLVELHGGTVEARAPARGGRDLHRAPADAGGPGDAFDHSFERRSRRRAPSRLDGVRVLVVDDESDARGAITAVLEQGGAVVTPSDSVASAIQKMHSAEFDAVISDIGMPVEDGYALIRRMREMMATKDRKVPSLALTAYANTAEVEKILSAGFDAALTKPIEARDLIAEVARLTHAK